MSTQLDAAGSPAQAQPVWVRHEQAWRGWGVGGGEGANVKARGGVVTRLGHRCWGRCHGITQPKTLGSAPLPPSRQRAFNY